MIPIIALLMVGPLNWLISRTQGRRTGLMILFFTIIPAAALVAFTGYRLAYAVINADEVNRKFRAGDLTYFGADMAFGMALLFGGLWVFLAFVGFRWGRADRRLK